MALTAPLGLDREPEGSTSPASILTLGELLADPALALELVVGADADRARRVAGTQSIELPLRVRWLAPARIGLTTGLHLRRNPTAQRELIAKLQSSHLTALGFALGPVFRSIPRAMLDEAAKRGFPVIAVPARTPLRVIAEAVNRRLDGDDQIRLRRVLAMQEYLIDALAESDPQAELVARLSAVLEAGVAVLSPLGDIVDSIGRLPPDAWEQIQESGLPDEEIAPDRVCVLDDGRLLLAPIVCESHLVAWLVVAQRRAGASTSRLAVPVVRVARRVLAALAGASRLADREDRVLRVEMLNAALDGIPSSEVERLEARARAAGFDFDALVRVAVFELADGSTAPPGSSAARPGDLLRIMADGLRSAGTPVVLTHRHDLVVGLVQGDDDMLRSLLAGTGPAARAGVGRALASLADARVSYRDACIALASSRRQTRADALTSVEQLELVEAILSRCEADELGPSITRWLGPLRNDPMLWHTLTAYLSCDMDVQRTSRQLYLHANSVRYRLQRIESLLGEPLRRASTLANLYVAYLADSTMSARAVAGDRPQATDGSPHGHLAPVQLTG